MFKNLKFTLDVVRYHVVCLLLLYIELNLPSEDLNSITIMIFIIVYSMSLYMLVIDLLSQILIFLFLLFK